MPTPFFEFILTCPERIWFYLPDGLPPPRARKLPMWVSAISAVEARVLFQSHSIVRMRRTANQVLGGLGELWCYDLMRDWLQPPPIQDYDGNHLPFRMLEDNDPVDMVFVMYDDEGPIFVHVCVKASTQAYSQPASEAFNRSTVVLMALPLRTMIIRVQFKHVAPDTVFFYPGSYCRLLVSRNF